MTSRHAFALILKPFMLLYEWALGVLYYCIQRILHHTCRVRFEGTDLSTHNNYILCIWHESFPLVLTVFSRLENQVWMAHPVWYMRHVIVLLRLMGMKHICLGSSGHGGMRALAKVVANLKRGYSTTIACDGPDGPVHELKKGVLIMGRNTGLPVIAVRFKSSCTLPSPEWDQKRIPLPFSKIIVQVANPVYITRSNFEDSAKTLSDWLLFK